MSIRRNPLFVGYRLFVLAQGKATNKAYDLLSEAIPSPTATLVIHSMKRITNEGTNIWRNARSYKDVLKGAFSQEYLNKHIKEQKHIESLIEEAIVRNQWDIKLNSFVAHTVYMIDNATIWMKKLAIANK